MIHEVLTVGMLQCNCSVFGDETTREAMVVDPGDDIAEILEIVARHSFHAKPVLRRSRNAMVWLFFSEQVGARS